MAERMTFEEIECAFPGEWVVVRDFVADEARMIKDGVLVAHTPDRDTAHHAVRSFEGDFALWFVGPALGDGFVRTRRTHALGFDRDDFEVACHRFAPGAQVDGLLGVDFLAGSRLTIDFVARFVELSAVP
ncbi:MAG: hypothetical protein HY907_21890 [Deltaproteobacteria bacterium]|nr:hypothetical protein [Deltaproteobacteria bacterium]